MGRIDENKTNNSADNGKVANYVNSSVLNSLTLLTGMSHEIRTYINAIVGFSSLLRISSSNKEEDTEIKDQIYKSCEQLIELFDSFLDTAIIDNGGLETDLRRCNLDGVLAELIAEFREELKKTGNNEVNLETECHFLDISDTLIDQGKLLRIIRCLFQNAVKNTESGYIKIGYDYSNGSITFYILDSSHCYYKYKEFLYTEDMNKSLKIFFDTSSAVNIILAKKLIRYLGGTIWVNWNGFTGTGVYFSIPLKVNGITSVLGQEFAKSVDIY